MVKFSTFQLIIGSQQPSLNDLQMIKSKGQSFYEFGDDLYEFVIEFDKDSCSLWIYAQYDNKTIYNEEVFNESSKKKEKNPRSKAQVELRKQVFACYSMNHHILYISNLNKRNMISSYLSNVLQVSVQIKNTYTSIDEFQKSVRYIKEAQFIHYNNLISQECGVFDAINNIYGLGVPSKMRLNVEYNNTPIGEIAAALKHLKEKNRKGETESVVIIGIDDNDLERSFDLSTVINHINVDSKKCDNGRYNADEVKLRLREKISCIKSTS